MVCSKCGHKLPDDSEFCQYCGFPVPKEELRPVSVPDQASPTAKNDSVHVFAEVMANYAAEAAKAAESNKGIQNQHVNESDFGLVPEKPIYTKGIDEQKKYLQSLQTIDGRQIKWERRGSLSVADIHGMIDIYEISLLSGEPHSIIYMNMYGTENSSGVPHGLTRKGSSTHTKQPKKRKSHWKLIAGIGAAVISTAIIVVLVVSFLIPWINYNHARKLLESGNYDLAYTAFSELGDYSNAQEMLKETRYLQAVKYRDNGDFELANDIFKSLGNYRDSKKLIHTHEYRATDRKEATCTVSGSETYTCTGCNDSYVKHLDASHKYVVSTSVDATCTATGSKTYQCTACGNQYSENVPKKSHSYSAATCTDPKTCTVCKTTSGSALGHTNNLICTRCGKNTFEKLTFSGHGPSSITNINLPVGTYNIILTHNGRSNFIAYLTGGAYSDTLIVNEIGYTSFVYQITSYEWSSARIQNGYINVTNADGSWTITIEAVSN